MKRLASFVLAATLAVPALSAAQATNRSAATVPATTTSANSVDVSKLGVSFDRIRRELAQAEVSEQQSDAVRLEFHVQVIGQAPRIDLLGDFDLDAPSIYGAPTHREVVEFLTPQEFRAPAASISSVVFWAVQKLEAHNKKSRCEREIAEYRALVMQGVAVAAPRCTQ